MGRLFRSGVVPKDGDGSDPTPARSVRHEQWRRTLFLTRYSLQDAHIDERFIDVSIIVLIGVLRKGLCGQARSLGAAVVPEDLLDARKR
jgi:hypothetical protein